MIRFVLPAVWLLGCSQMMGGPDGGGGGRAGGGSAAGGTAGGFTVIDLDANARGLVPFAMAVDPVERRVVVAYFAPKGTQTTTGHDDYNLNVIEWRESSGPGQPQTLRFMQRLQGLSIALHPTTKEPTVAFLGGADRFVPGDSAFWFQNDAALSTRAGTTWTETVVTRLGNVCTTGPRDSTTVGLWPAIRFTSQGRLVYAYRDINFAQNPTDYTGSDVEGWEGPLGALTPKCVFGGFDTKPGRGTRLMMAPGPSDETILVYDQNATNAEGPGQDVVMQRFTGGNWSPPVVLLRSTNTLTGPQVAWDATEGYAVAVTRGSELLYRHSADGATWDMEESVVNTGSGGWYPSLAIDPVNHEPNLAFYDCSATSNVLQPDCPPDQDALRVTFRGGGRWQNAVTVDAEGGWAPKLAFFANGKRVLVYRVSDNADHSARVGVLKLAVER